jgi:hypothetical protein
MTQSPKHHSSRKRSLIISVAALLALTGTCAVAYALYFWNHTPEMIVAKAFENVLDSEHVSYTVHVNSPTEKMAVVNGSYADGRSHLEGVIRTPLPNDLSELKGSLVSYDDRMYARVENVEAFLSRSAPSSQQELVDSLLKKYGNVLAAGWVSIDPRDVALLEGITRTPSCLVESIRLFTTDRQSRADLKQLYRANPFLQVKQVTMKDAIGTYTLTIDKNRFHRFLDALSERSPDVVFSKCFKEIDALKASRFDTAVIATTINTTTNTIQRISMTVSATGVNTVDIDISDKSPVAIQKPKESIRFEDIKADIFEQLRSSYGRRL